jgi:hypothetical protein
MVIFTDMIYVIMVAVCADIFPSRLSNTMTILIKTLLEMTFLITSIKVTLHTNSLFTVESKVIYK